MAMPGAWGEQAQALGARVVVDSGTYLVEGDQARSVGAAARGREVVTYTGTVNYRHTTGYADSITMSPYIEDGPLFSNIVVENSPDRQTTW
ncbi:hypothetical protein ACIRF8_14265 [Streptomyces sp. NPDC102406]|uniref:hypothetical protein n=1 Tax=Streptomyces sp. NPDC102406 TaxID=3366171 RepID=UPI003811C9BF